MVENEPRYMVFTVFEAARGCWHPAYCAVDRDDAIRLLLLMASGEPSVIEDPLSCSLWQVGEFDDRSGELLTLDRAVRVADMVVADTASD